MDVIDNTYKVYSKSIANFEFPRVMYIRFFCGLMLILMFLINADKYGHFECSVNFGQLLLRFLPIPNVDCGIW